MKSDWTIPLAMVMPSSLCSTRTPTTNGAILDFRIRDDSFGVRNPGSIDTSALPHRLDEWMEVLVTWEYPGGDTTLLPEVTISVDGVALAHRLRRTTHRSVVSHTLRSALVTTVACVKRRASSVLMSWVSTADTDGMTRVFFRRLRVLSRGRFARFTDNAASPYHSNTSEATVGAEPDEAGGPGTPGNKVAEIIDTDAGDTGELRYALDSTPARWRQGDWNVAVKRLDDTLGNGDAFITLFNSDTNNAGAILDFRIRDDSFGVRNPSDDRYIIRFRIRWMPG